MLQRALIGPYILVFGGLLIGLLVGVFVVDADPPLLGWLFGAGAGLAGGAFVAALASGEQLLGGGRPRQREWRFEDDWDSEDDSADIPARER